MSPATYRPSGKADGTTQHIAVEADATATEWYPNGSRGIALDTFRAISAILRLRVLDGLPNSERQSYVRHSKMGLCSGKNRLETDWHMNRIDPGNRRDTVVHAATSRQRYRNGSCSAESCSRDR